jgi:hypothetical protein
MQRVIYYECMVTEDKAMKKQPGYILQTYFHWNEIEERGFSREFDTLEGAEEYARQNMCGSRHTITESEEVCPK